MKHPAAAQAFVIARHTARPWAELVPLVVDDIVARHTLAGGVWIVRGQVGKRIGCGELRRRHAPHNDRAGPEDPAT